MTRRRSTPTSSRAPYARGSWRSATGRGAGELAYDDLLAGEARPVPPLQDPEELAALLYTSGTSGRPRAAMLTHRALLANIEQVAQVEPPMIHGDDVVLGVLPLFHVYGLNAVLGGVLRHRAKLVLVERFDPQATLDLDRGRGVQRAAGRAAGLRPLAGRSTTSPSGSARSGWCCPARRRWRPRWSTRSPSAPAIPVHQGYGLTEAAPVVTSTLCSEALQSRLGGRGPARHRAAARRRDRPGARRRATRARSRSAAPTSSAATGPTAPTGPTPRAGGPPATSASSTPTATCSSSTGSRSWSSSRGFNVYPTEVEEVHRARSPASLEAAVIGVEDAATGEAVVAYVVAPGRRPRRPRRRRAPSTAAVRLARFKQPTRIEVVDELPHTVTGKVQKGRLRGLERRRALGLLE